VPGLDSCMAVGLSDTLVWPMQDSEASALQRAVAAESSNAQLTQEGQNYQRAIQELRNSRDATAALHQQALQTLQNAKTLAEVRLCASCLWCTLWCMFCSIIRSHIPWRLPHLHLFAVLNSPPFLSLSNKTH